MDDIKSVQEEEEDRGGGREGRGSYDLEPKEDRRFPRSRWVLRDSGLVSCKFRGIARKSRVHTRTAYKLIPGASRRGP